LTALDLVTLSTTEKTSNVLTSATLIEELAEHLNTSDGSLAWLADTNDIHFVTYVDDTTLNTTSRDSTTSLNREHVLNRHEESTVDITLRKRDVIINLLHEVHDILNAVSVTLKGLESRTEYHWAIVESVLRELFFKLHLHELNEVRVSDVSLVKEDDDRRYANLTSEEDVLFGLWHRAVSCRTNEDRAVHLGSTCDHVLYIVSVTRAVNVSIVTRVGLVLDVSRRDGNTALTLFRGVVDIFEVHDLTASCLSEHLSDRCGEGGLSVIHVTDGTNVHVGLSPLKTFFSHLSVSMMEVVDLSPTDRHQIFKEVMKFQCFG
jgi:hypothetical protein